MKDFGFIDSLNIDSMVILIKESYRGFADLKLDNFFSTDERVLEYRLGVVSDLIAQSSEFQTLNTELSKMETTFGYLKSVTLGINLDGNLCPLDARIVSVNINMFISLLDDIRFLTANGKSIFAYSIGMAQALFQLGLFVPAESALMSPFQVPADSKPAILLPKFSPELVSLAAADFTPPISMI